MEMTKLHATKERTQRNKRLDKIEELNNKIDYDNLKYVVE